MRNFASPLFSLLILHLALLLFIFCSIYDVLFFFFVQDVPSGGGGVETCFSFELQVNLF